MENTVLIAALIGNIVTSLVGFTVLISKVQKASQWKGWADTKIKSNCSRLNRHGEKLDDYGDRLARHEGAG